MSDHEPTFAELMDALRREVGVVRDAQQQSTQTS